MAQHALETIRQSGSLPMAKADLDREKRLATRDDTLTGNTWANRMIAAQMSAGQTFSALALELFTMTHEARAAAINAVKAWIKGKKTEMGTVHEGMEAKRISKILNSATVYVSQCNTIANAMQAGMTPESLAAHCKCKPEELPHVGLALFYEHAQMFSKAKAGRKPDDFLTKMAKFLDQTKNVEGQDELHRDAFVKLYNTLAKG